MSDYSVLRKLGLSKKAVICYESLFEDGAATAAQLGTRLRQSRTGLYRILRGMERQGFVSSLKTTAQPTYFDSELLDTALTKFHDYQRRLLRKLVKEQAEILTKRSGKQTPL